MRENPPHLFLNCTKNTELTRAHFTRTVSFALSTNTGHRSSPRRPDGDRIQSFHEAPLHSGQRAMKSVEWKTYRTRFLVKAKQLSSPLSFTDPLGRQHCGRKGDYLVESSDGVISIAPRKIFEDIYVSMASPDQPHLDQVEDELRSHAAQFTENNVEGRTIEHLQVEALNIEEVNFRRSPISRQPVAKTHIVRPAEAASGRRKLPQPCRDRRSSPSRLNLM
jgi:hypothetical protein